MSRGLLDRISEFFRPEQPLWACELTPRHVVVAGVDGRRLRMEGKASVPLPPESIAGSLAASNIAAPEIVRLAIRDALRAAGFKGHEIGIVIPDDAARISFLTAGDLPGNLEEQRTFIRWKLKKTIPFDVDTAQVSFRVLGPRSLLVAMSPRAVIEEYERLMEELDLQAGFVIPSTLAALNLFTAPAADALFLKVGANCITTTIFQNGVMQFYRRVSDASLYDAVYPTILYYQDKLGGKDLDHVTLCGYNGDVRRLVSELQEKLGFAAQRLEPKSVEDMYKPALGAVSWAGG